MIGAGIFILPSLAAGEAGPASILSFVGGGFISLLAAFSLSELSTSIPKTGGSYHYVNHSLGGFFGSVVGWGMWIGLMFASAFYMIGFGQYLTYFFGNVPVAVVALIMAFVLIGVNYYGVKETGVLQNFIVVLLVGLILVFILAGFPSVDFGNLQPFNPKGWGAVASTVGAIFVSFIGFEVIASSAEEIKNPERNLPLAMIAAVLTPIALYVLVMVVSIGVLSSTTLAETALPVAEVAREFLGSIGGTAMVVGAIFATVSSANASILSATRINFAMGRDKILPDWLNEIHENFRTPYRSIIITGGIILLLIASGVGIGTLAKVAGFAYLVTYALLHVSVIIMRNIYSEVYNPSFESPLYPITQIVGIVSCAFAFLIIGKTTLVIGAIIMLVGGLGYVFYSKERAKESGLLIEAVSPEHKPREEEGKYKIVVGVSYPETERELLKYASAIASNYEDGELIAVNVVEVPPQLTPEQSIAFEKEKAEQQKALLSRAEELSEEFDIRIRTQALVGSSVSKSILNVIEEEEADQVLLGWRGEFSVKEYILGSNIDSIASQAPCEVTVVKFGREKIGSVLALVGSGPNASLAVRRAHEINKKAGVGELTVLNARKGEKEEEEELRNRGIRMIEKTTNKARLESSEYKPKVIIGEDVEKAILEEVKNYDTICIGGTEHSVLSHTIFGSLPEKIGEIAEGSVVMVKGYRKKDFLQKIGEKIARLLP